MGPLEIPSTGNCCQPTDRQKKPKCQRILGFLCIFPAVLLLVILRDLLVADVQDTQVRRDEILAMLRSRDGWLKIKSTNASQFGEF